MQDATSFLLGGSGGKSAKFDHHGATVAGTISQAPEVRQQTKLEDGTPLTWDNGDPKMQLVVTLQTDLREDGDDDGIRKLYVKGSKDPASKSLHAAVAGAVQAAGAKSLEVGGRLSVTYVGDGVAKTRGYTAPKQYEASYTPAAAGFLAVDEQVVAAVADLAPPGFTQQQWDSFNDVQKAALRNVPATGTDGPPF
jgi:hypothetical protein